MFTYKYLYLLTMNLNSVSIYSHYSLVTIRVRNYRLNPYFCINHRDQRGFFNLKSSYMPYIALSASFEYLCYGSIYGIINILGIFLSARGRHYKSESNVYRRQILSYKDGSRAERAKPNSSILHPFSLKGLMSSIL